MSKKNSLEVLSVEAEEMPLEVELDGKINKELVKVNVTDVIVAKLKEQYSGLTLKSKDDTESYLELKEARKVVRKVEILGEKAFKELKEYPNKVRNYILKKEKEFAEKFTVIYPNLDNGIKEYEDEKLRKENEEKERKEKIFQERQATLIKYGATYDSGSLVLNHISYEIDNIREADEEIFTSIILPKYKDQFEKAEAERVRLEKEREAAALKLKKEQEELKKQQEEMDKQRKELAKAQAEMQKMKDDAEREKKRQEQEKFDLQQKERREKISKRINQLSGLGLVYNMEHDSYIFEDTAVSRVVEIEGMNDKDWDDMVIKIIPGIEKNKKQLEEKRIADEEAQRQRDIEAALQKEREKVAEQKRLDELKIEQERQRKEEELEQANDKTKWNEFLKSIIPSSYPEMKSGIYRRKVNISREKLEEIISL